MRVLITGGTGFLGQHLLPKLQPLEAQHTFALTVRQPQAQWPYRQMDTRENLADQVADFAPEVIIHLATYFTVRHDPVSAAALFETNVLFGTALLQGILQNNHLKYFVNGSSFNEFYDSQGVLNPTNLYAASKTSFRFVLKYFQDILDFKTVHAVIYSLYGGGDRNKKVLDYLIESLNATEPVGFSAGWQRLDFIHVEDVSDFFVHLLTKLDVVTAPETDFHVGTGTSTNLREVASLLTEIAGRPPHTQWGVRPDRPKDTVHAVAPITSTVVQLGWRPQIDLKTGLTRLLNS